MKRNTMKQTIAVFLASLMAVQAGGSYRFPLSAFAEEVPYTGTCGESLEWLVLGNGVLKITGKGNMPDYTQQDAPWEMHRETIREVHLGDGVASIGADAFSQCTALERVQIPDSTQKIGANAFKDCQSLRYVLMNQTSRVIVENAFEGTPFLQYYTTEQLKGMDKGAAGLMRGKQLVVNIFVDEVTKTEDDSLVIADSWQPEPDAGNEHAPVLLDCDNFYAYLRTDDTDKTVLPQDSTDAAGQPVSSEAIAGRLAALEHVLTEFETQSEEFRTDPDTKLLEFVEGPNYFFTYQATDGAVSIAGDSLMIGGTYSNGAELMRQLTEVSGQQVDLRTRTDSEMNYREMLMEEYDADGVLFLFHHNAPTGKTIVFPEDSYEECAMLCTDEEAVLAEQILTMYSANETEYGIPAIAAPIENGEKPYTLMLCNGSLLNSDVPDGQVSPLSAYVRGWNRTIESSVYFMLGSGKNYPLFDVNLDSTYNEDDAELISGYFKGEYHYEPADIYGTENSCYLPPLKRMFAGYGISGVYTGIEGWTNDVNIESYGDAGLLKISNAKHPGSILRPCNDVNFDGLVTTGDKDLHDSYPFHDGWADVNYLQAVMILKSKSSKFPQPFTIGRDTWYFANDKSFFGETYSMKKGHKKLLESISSEIGQWNSNRFLHEDQFAGSCYGMCATTLLTYYGLVLPQQLDEDAKTLHDVGTGKNSEAESIESYINYYHVSQRFKTQRSNLFAYPDLPPIASILACLDDGSPTIVSYKYAKGEHAVIAYGVTYGRYMVNNLTYDGKIQIYDPDHPDGDDTWCIYFKSFAPSEYCIPGRNAFSQDETLTILGAQDKLSVINDEVLVEGKVSLHPEKRFNASVRAADMITDYAFGKGTTLPDVVKNTEIGSDIIVPAQIAGMGESVYFMMDAKSPYFLKLETPNEFDVQLNYPDCKLHAYSINSTSVIFYHKGKIEMQARGTSYEFCMEEETSVTDWESITVKDEKTGDAALERAEDGYLLTSSDMADVNVICTAPGICAEVTFTTDYEKVFLYEIDKYTIGVAVDADGDGTFETPIAQSDEGTAGDLNNDKAFTVLDLVAMKRWLLSGNVKLINSRNADFTKDDVLDGFDFAIMKRKLLES
ncbi:MAG: hypothetical protein E7502_01225 [Ruminococcus sp.]|nr:hypothetical protein [Ruminococcus sp.]